jgi:hypothetical protein
MSKNFEIWYDEEQGVLYLKPFRTMTEEDVRELMALRKTKFTGTETDYVLADMSETTTELPTKEARKVFKESLAILNSRKVAVVGASPAARMMAKIVLALTGQSKISHFFKTEAEALAWLKGDK